MGYAEAIQALDRLKGQGIIREYALIGAVAAAAYSEPVATEDLDIVVLVDTDEQYLDVLRASGAMAERREGMHLVFGGVPVQMFPTTIKALYREALEQGKIRDIGAVRVRVASCEHLILLALEAFRYKDRARVYQLLPVANKERLKLLLTRLDDEKHTLASRLRTLGGEIV